MPEREGNGEQEKTGESGRERERDGERGGVWVGNTRERKSERELFFVFSLQNRNEKFSVFFSPFDSHSRAPRSIFLFVLFPALAPFFPEFEQRQAQTLPCRHPANDLNEERETSEVGTAAAKMSSRGGDDDRRGGKHGGDNSFAAACAAPPAAPTDRADDDQASTSGAFIIHKVNKGDEKGLFEAPWPTKTMRLAEGQKIRGTKIGENGNLQVAFCYARNPSSRDRARSPGIAG